MNNFGDYATYDNFGNNVSQNQTNYGNFTNDNKQYKNVTGKYGNQDNYAINTMSKMNMLKTSPILREFFGKNNIKRLQKKIRKEIYEKTKGSFEMEVDQDEQKLLIIMKKIYEYHCRNLPTGIVRQTKCLNKHLIDSIVPDMIGTIKEHYSYIKDISTPLKPMDRPINVNGAGRKTLPSITTIWQ